MDQEIQEVTMEPKWLKWAKSLQAVSQNGLTYSENVFDTDRYKKIREIALEIISSYSNMDFDKVKNLFDNEEGYLTPKVDVRGAVFKENKILLVKEIADGKWTLPGGWADPNETPSESIEREVFEESGYLVKARNIIAVYDRTKQGHTPFFPFHVYKIFFMCELTGGKKTNSIETDGIDFFAKDEIPALSESRIKMHQIERIFEHHYNPGLPTDFD